MNASMEPATVTVAAVGATAPESPALEPAGRPAGGVIRVENLSAYYATQRAVRDVTLDFQPNAITAIIGPSGSGKSTLLRCMNRMHEVIPRGRVEGLVEYRGVDIYDPRVDPAAVRRSIGMVFQQPNPFPTKSIAENVVAAARFNGLVKGRGPERELVERLGLHRVDLRVALDHRQRQRRVVALQGLDGQADALLDEARHPEEGLLDQALLGVERRSRIAVGQDREVALHGGDELIDRLVGGRTGAAVHLGHGRPSRS